MKQIKGISLSVMFGLMMVQAVSASSQKRMYALNPETVVKQMSDNRFNQQASNQILNTFMSQMQQLTPAQRAPYAQRFERAYSSYFPGFIAHYDAATNQLSYEHLPSGVVARSYGVPVNRGIAPVQPGRPSRPMPAQRPVSAQAVSTASQQWAAEQAGSSF